MGRIRVVVDTNVLISALHFGDGPDKVLALARRGEIELFISPFILEELERVLGEKFGWSTAKVELAISKIKGFSMLVEPTVRVEAVKEKDSDNRILECALAAGANYLITGDTKHLLPLERYEGIEIVSPEGFLGIVGRIS